MKRQNEMTERNQGGTNVNVDIDVTKIVKYSCITSAVIVFIVFASNVVKKYFDHCDQ